ncbi:MAG TPA: hypothetical protein VLA05_10600 [Coriobacteriia bacterium]|nr:hypothetical protein [Coriobacteriia bacterium]
MRRIIALVAFACLLLAAVGSPAACPAKTATPTTSPNSPTSAELVEHPKQWDGETITFAGEAITQAMIRGDHAWIHVNDDAYYLKNVEEGAPLGGYNSGHAIWLPANLVRKITYYGDYTHEGDVVSVTGVFNAACGEHGGDMDIHATSLDVVAEGHEFEEPVSLEKLGAAVALVALAGLLWFANRKATHADTFGAAGNSKR